MTQATFPNPCPVCGTDDNHAAWVRGFMEHGGIGDMCPHPAERGHGTGCCCLTYPRTLRVPLPSLSPPPLTPDVVRQLLRESVTVVKPGEVLFFTCGDPNYTPVQIREIQDVASAWLEAEAPDVRVMILPHGDMTVAEAPA